MNGEKREGPLMAFLKGCITGLAVFLFVVICVALIASGTYLGIKMYVKYPDEWPAVWEVEE